MIDRLLNITDKFRRQPILYSYKVLKKIISKFILVIKTPRLTILLFQIRVIERYFKIDLFFFSPRRLIIFIIECLYFKSSKDKKLTKYGNYQLDKSKVTKNPLVYSGGIGKNITFDLSFFKKHKGKLRLFDPTKSSVEYMASLKLNKNIKFYPYALFHKNKKVKLFQDPSQRVKSASIINFFSFDKKSFFIANAYNLPTLKKRFKDRAIDVLKLDIEGVAEDLILGGFKKNIYPAQIVSAFEVPLNYIEFYRFIKKILNFIKILKRDYKVYNLRYRSRGVEMEILAIKK